jgi:hypothetical protein
VSIGARPSDRTDLVTSSTQSAVFGGPPRIETTERSYAAFARPDETRCRPERLQGAGQIEQRDAFLRGNTMRRA